MKVLILGGAGFVGRHYTEFFLKKNFKVHCVDNIAPLTGGIHPKKWMVFKPLKNKNFYFEKRDCRSFFKDKIKKRYDLIINLAAIVGGREVIEYNPLAVAEDLEIDTSFWRWILKAKPLHVITYSSSAAYPISLQTRDNYRLLKESDISFQSGVFGMPDMSYGWAKLNNEYLSKLAFDKYNIKNTVFRPFSGYGYDQDLNYPFPSILKRAILHDEKKDFIVWGTGKQMRDFVHIKDIVKNSFLLSKKIKNGDAINLSTGKFTSFVELANLSLSLLGKKNIKVIGNSTKPEGVFARAGSFSLQKKYGAINKIRIKKGIKDSIKILKKIYQK